MKTPPLSLGVLIAAFAQVSIAFGAELPVVRPRAVSAESLATVAEQSNNLRTGRYDEVIRLCAALMRRWPDEARCFQFGTTPEGRPMLALALSADGTLSAPAARARHRPVVLFQGGIHAGEIDGKDAGFLLVRELLETPEASAHEAAAAMPPSAPSSAPPPSSARDVLAKITAVFVPVFNVDGHERFGRWNRPNQRGPEEMGWRTTAQNYNLNRDYMKGDTPEMQAMQKLLNDWDPLVYVDLHVTDGAQFQADLSITNVSGESCDPQIGLQSDHLRDELNSRLQARGFTALAFYPSFVRDDDPASGFALSPTPPRFSHGYWPLSNRIGLLVETHSWKDYARRVRMTHDMLAELMIIAGRDGAAWREAAQVADTRAKALGGTSIPLRFENTPHTRSIDFPGYVYERKPSAISGEPVPIYDETRPQVWHVPLFDEVKVTLTAVAPRGGYLIPAAYAALLAPRLKLHGIRFVALPSATAEMPVKAWRATKVSESSETFEGHTTFALEGAWHEERGAVSSGSLFVPIAQAKARLVVWLLEPQAPDSYASWGLFSTAFERKEYMEGYVVEQVAKDMLARDPALATEFRHRLDSDPGFKNSADARRDFFYRRHPSWDERLNLYPVYRLETVPAGG